MMRLKLEYMHNNPGRRGYLDDPRELLKKEGMITDFIINNMMGWHHSGFNIYCGKTLWPDNEEGIENLARYIIRASFSSERMTPYRSTGQALYPRP